MNRKGQTLFLSILIAVMIFAFGMLVLNFLLPDVDTARTALNCTNATISDGNKIACLGTDGVVPYFIILIISTGGGLVLSKLIL